MATPEHEGAYLPDDSNRDAEKASKQANSADPSGQGTHADPVQDGTTKAQGSFAASQDEPTVAKELEEQERPNSAEGGRFPAEGQTAEDKTKCWLPSGKCTEEVYIQEVRLGIPEDILVSPQDSLGDRRSEYTFQPKNGNTCIAADTVAIDEATLGAPTHLLMQEYDRLRASGVLVNDERLYLRQILGSGGQGIVYLSERQGTDGFQLPVALKFFSPESFHSVTLYEHVMKHNAVVAAEVAQIQHDNLLDVRNWFVYNNIRVMEMEWVDGFDLGRLMNLQTLQRMKEVLSPADYESKTRVVVTYGHSRARFQPGIALTIIRDCLDALGALHNRGIVHSDIKPSNIMLKMTGAAKIVDLGGAFFYKQQTPARLCSPAYAAPEILDGGQACKASPQSDIASLGYVLIELLSGSTPSDRIRAQHGTAQYPPELRRYKLNLVDELPQILPVDVRQNSQLVEFCRRMIHPNLDYRFQSASDAIVAPGGVGELLRGLVKVGLASEYDQDLRSWMSMLRHGGVV